MRALFIWHSLGDGLADVVGSPFGRTPFARASVVALRAPRFEPGVPVSAKGSANKKRPPMRALFNWHSLGDGLADVVGSPFGRTRCARASVVALRAPRFEPGVSDSAKGNPK